MHCKEVNKNKYKDYVKSPKLWLSYTIKELLNNLKF